MQTVSVILLQKFARILSWQSNSKNKPPIRPCSRILFVSKRCKRSWESNPKKTKKNGEGRRRNANVSSRNESA
jgi:hypothetical protein